MIWDIVIHFAELNPIAIRTPSGCSEINGVTVNSEIFVRTLFSPIALNDTFAALKKSN